MRQLTYFFLVTSLILAGCAQQAPEPSVEQTAMPDDEAHRGMQMPPDSMHGSGMGSQLNREIVVAEDILDDWSGIRVRLQTREGGDAQDFEVGLGETVALGDSGLSLEAKLFVPAFVMDENGINSSSAEQENPAARVVIRQEGMEDYEGWLFAAMPEIHPFPHETYAVTLVEGIPTQ